MEESVNSPRRKAAEKMTDLEREDQLFELNELYKNWRNSTDKDIQEQMQLLQVKIYLTLSYVEILYTYNFFGLTCYCCCFYESMCCLFDIIRLNLKIKCRYLTQFSSHVLDNNEIQKCKYFEIVKLNWVVC